MGPLSILPGVWRFTQLADKPGKKFRPTTRKLRAAVAFGVTPDLSMNLPHRVYALSV